MQPGRVAGARRDSSRRPQSRDQSRRYERRGGRGGTKWERPPPLGPRASKTKESVAETNRDDVHLRAGHLGFNQLVATDVHCHVLVAVVPVEEEVAGLDVDEHVAMYVGGDKMI